MSDELGAHLEALRLRLATLEGELVARAEREELELETLDRQRAAGVEDITRLEGALAELPPRRSAALQRLEWARSRHLRAFVRFMAVLTPFLVATLLAATLLAWMLFAADGRWRAASLAVAGGLGAGVVLGLVMTRGRRGR